ncbi:MULTISPECIES: hypothetical protein [Acinetobacter]|uniref:Uncharacterized protein n=1 Tax=Acinetobacter variabilis TaxID=70346 RepID=N8VET4_9GAMM|nr:MULTISPECIES: hypothetical protein [Acinetobacter]ENU98085.1 hypothetical protein F969_03008 [Acinetobacter variabilis]
MHRHYIHIGIAGLSIHDADELKKTLQHITPDHFILQWNTASDPHLDCLLVYEYFLETEGIQRVLKNQKCPYLCISKNDLYSNQIINNTLALPLQNTQILKHWFEQNVLNSEITSEIEEPIFSSHVQIQQSSEHPYTINFFKEMLHPEKGKLHLYDRHGTIAIIDSAKNLAWLNKDRAETGTDFSFQYDFASTSDLLKVTRRETQILQDWLWNFFWNSPSFAQIAPEDGHYKIHYWPKPAHPLHKKRIFQISACFIQGAKISKIAEQHAIPLLTLRQFITASMASGNIEKINAWESRYRTTEPVEKTEQQNFIKSFFGKLRFKFGF